MRRILILGVLAMTVLAGCGTGGTAVLFGEQPIETGKPDFAPTGSEYELLYNKEVTNVHNAIVSLLSLNNTGNINNSPKITENDKIVCTEAMNNCKKSYNAIQEVLPAKGWEDKKENFLKTVDAILESVSNSLDSEKLDTATLSKLEVGLSALSANDSGASSLNL